MNSQVIYLPKDAIVRAATQFETPFFLYEEKRLRENCRNFKNAFTKYFPDFHALYAVKANNNPEILKIIKEEGYGFDCSSESEAWVVKKIGGWGMYTGNYTPAKTLAYAKDCGLMLNLDDVSMVPMLKEIGYGVSTDVETFASGTGETPVLSFRINPGIGKGGTESVVTAGPDAKFGVPFEKAAEAYKAAQETGVKKFGIHMMTGSNVLDEEYFAKTVERLLEIVADIKEKTGIEIDYTNIGGGFGVAYHPDQNSLDLEKLAAGIKEVFDQKCAEHNLKAPVLMAEPGRYIAADMGFLIGKVEVIKDGYKKFVGIDASSNDMPRPSIYGAYHHVTVVKKALLAGDTTEPEDKNEVVTVVGTICENNDQLAKDRELPVCEIGDIIALHNCGAHAYAMGHNYNGKLKHAEYLLQENGDIKMIRRAETIEDLYGTTMIRKLGILSGKGTVKFGKNFKMIDEEFNV